MATSRAWIGKDMEMWMLILTTLCAIGAILAVFKKLSPNKRTVIAKNGGIAVGGNMTNNHINVPSTPTPNNEER